MKKLLSSCFSLLICLSFVVSPLCLGAESVSPIVEIIAETVFSEFIGEGVKEAIEDNSLPDAGIFGCAEKVMKRALEIAMQNPSVDSNTGDISLTVPNFDIITGKEQLQWTVRKRNNLGEVTETFTDSILIEVTFLLTDNWSGQYYDKNTGVTYYSNALNICITRTNGSVARYVVVFGDSFNYSRNVTWSYPTVSISAQSGCTLYSVSGGVIGQALQTNFYTENVIFNIDNLNSITTDLNSLINNANAYPDPIGIYSRRGSAIAADGITYPVDVDICHGVFNFRLLGLNNGTKYEMGVYCNRYLKTGFMVTNNPIHIATNNTYYSTNNYSNNYYNYPLTGGTIIDKNNYIDKDLPTLAPVFDLDTSLPDWDLDLLDLIPSILDLLDGDLLPDLTDLLGKLLDFFGAMPDIDMEWNPDTSLNTNNYWDLDFPSDDSGGGGSGGNVIVTVDVNVDFPPVTVQTHAVEDIVSVNTFPVIETYTVPPAIQTQAETFLDSGESLVTSFGLLPVYAFLTLIGIAVAVIFKGA
ncbi:MAG: hypothetical protein J6T10_22055 [Methanobrevibacter sp.]|nr:hypothetical protein [Methanobrevibacter sp.]